MNDDVPENLLGTMDILQSLQGFPPSDSKQTNKRWIWTILENDKAK